MANAISLLGCSPIHLEAFYDLPTKNSDIHGISLSGQLKWGSEMSF